MSHLQRVSARGIVGANQYYYHDLFVKPAVTAGTAVVGSYLLLGDAASKGIMLGGMRIPVPMAVGGAVYIGSVLAELLHKQVWPNVGDRWGEPISLAVSGATTAGTATGAIYLAAANAPSEIGVAKLGLLGIASEIISESLYNRIVKPMLL